MSILSNINIGVNWRKEKNNLSQDTHSTAEIGYFQPTFCRDIVPRTHVRISAKSLCRLSPLAVPTMGRVSLRHYFFYVDYATLWTPFEALRTGNNYMYSDGTTQIPYAVPFFSMTGIFKYAFTNSELANDINGLYYCTLYKNGTIVTSIANELNAIYPSVLGTNNITCAIEWLPIYYKVSANAQRKITAIYTSSVTTGSTGIPQWFDDNTPIVTNKNADFSIRAVVGTDVYMFLCRFSPIGKRLRKHFLGCGFSFNPYDIQPFTPLKLLGEYKAWFDKFAVQRTINFNNTHCYQFIKYISELAPSDRVVPYIFTGYGTRTFIYTEFFRFLEDLSSICYVLPPDYFSASDITAQRGSVGAENNGGVVLQSPTFLAPYPSEFQNVNASYQKTPTADVNGSDVVTGLNVEMAERVLRWVNKRSVVGRKISELLKLEGESDTHNNAHEQVHKLGESKVDIQISDVISQADTSSASLGDYVGRGIGFKDSDTFVYDSPAYGFLLCLTAVVPTSGYFQGTLRENMSRERFEFFTEDYDALGYQSLHMSELISDMQFANSHNGSPVGTDLGYMGLVPRYQHLRVGRNICNGDISVPSMQDVMLPYNLDRHFITRVPSSGNTYDFDDVSVPNKQPELFRNVQADSGYGDYNRIFQYQANDYDHFILHIVFDCPILSPLKSVANAYDTFQDDDNKSIEMKHE